MKHALSSLFLIAVGSALLAAPPSSAKSAEGRPNIVSLYADDKVFGE